MNLNEENIGDFFKSNFENHKINPEPSIWNKIETQLAIKQFLRFNLSHFNVYYLSAILLIVSGLLFSNFADNNTIEANLAQNTKTKLETKKENNKINTSVIIEDVNTEIPEEAGKTTLLKRKKEKTSIEKTTTSKNEEEITENTIKGSASLSNLSDTNHTNENNTEEIIKFEEKAVFSLALEISENKGCCPLTISYTILSKNATKIELNSGDGTLTNKTSSTITYKKPGKYILNIQASNKSGETKNISKTIEVFPAPKPIAIVDADSDCKENCTVYFYNYSTDAQKYTWDFGDENYSRTKDPVHIYTQASNKTIKLKVWSKNMCVDSLLLETPFSDKKEYSILFPNAFIPSKSGSNNGYYSLYNYSSDIFYPQSSGVVQYKLEIYSRNGLLLFQTTDINQGWDGYYKYQLMHQDVYLWKATGKFENNEAFERIGDLTLIRK